MPNVPQRCHIRAKRGKAGIVHRINNNQRINCMSWHKLFLFIKDTDASATEQGIQYQELSKTENTQNLDRKSN